MYTYTHYDLDVGTITPLIKKNNKTCVLVRSTPLIRNPPLEGNNICYFQFRRRHDYPLIRNYVWSNLPPILNIGGFVDDRKNVDLRTTSIRKASEICCLVKPLKICGFVVDRKNIKL